MEASADLSPVQGTLLNNIVKHAAAYAAAHQAEAQVYIGITDDKASCWAEHLACGAYPQARDMATWYVGDAAVVRAAAGALQAQLVPISDTAAAPRGASAGVYLFMFFYRSSASAGAPGQRSKVRPLLGERHAETIAPRGRRQQERG